MGWLVGGGLRLRATALYNRSGVVGERLMTWQELQNQVLQLPVGDR